MNPKNAEITQHNVTMVDRAVKAAMDFDGDHDVSLAKWASDYVESEVIGVLSRNTAQAKKRDLVKFMSWFYENNEHLKIHEWMKRDTQGFLDSLEKEGYAATTINRIFATVRRFARWTADQPNPPFVGGLPTKGVSELAVDEPTAKGLSTREINRLFKAADLFVATEKRKNARPMRNRAVLALLYYTGLRVSELCNLRRDQYNGKHLLNVRRKGKSRTPAFYVAKDCRELLNEYIEKERPQDDPEGTEAFLILAPGGKGKLNRTTVTRILNRLGKQAGVDVHPHALRHTFAYNIRKKTGSDTETAALLGTSIAQVGRYARYTDSEREDVLDDL